MVPAEVPSVRHSTRRSDTPFSRFMRQPGYADALDSRGFVKLKIGLPSSAIADYDAALQTKKQASSLYGRGIAKKQTGNTAEGDNDIAAAKALDPVIAAEFDRDGIR
jgi:hypothetical protein